MEARHDYSDQRQIVLSLGLKDLEKILKGDMIFSPRVKPEGFFVYVSEGINENGLTPVEVSNADIIYIDLPHAENPRTRWENLRKLFGRKLKIHYRNGHSMTAEYVKFRFNYSQRH